MTVTTPDLSQLPTENSLPTAESEIQNSVEPPHGGFGIKLIASFKFISGVMLFAVGLGIFKLLRGDVSEVLAEWARQMHADPGNELINSVITKVSGLDKRYLRRAEIGTFCYSAVLFVEGVGLFFEKRWAEYLTVVATSSLLPFELYEVFEKVSILKCVALALNIFAVAYLLRRLQLTRKR